MLKRLLIVRHAHAEDIAESGEDFDRLLLPKGEVCAQDMSNWLSEAHISLDALYSSPALRAKKTAEIFAQTLAYPIGKINFIEAIYEAGLYNLLAIINRFPNNDNAVAIFGHNPSLTYLADYLGNQPIDTLPKGGMILITFETADWATVGQASGITHWLQSHKFQQVFVK